MNWVRAIASVLVLCSSTVWGATLTWSPDSDLDLAGYRVYQCSQQPCTRSSSNASPLVTLGTVTSFDIGTPTVTTYYFVTAYDTSNNESGGSNTASFTPSGAPPPVAPPIIGASPTNLSFTATAGSANPATQTLIISNTGGGTLSWSASDNAGWLTLSPASGTGNGIMTASVVTGSTSVGAYSGSITLTATGASPVTVPVTFTVNAPTVPPTKTAPPTPIGLHLGWVK